MKGTVEFSKQVKKPAKSQIFSRLREPKVCRYYFGTYVTILTEPDLSLQN